MFYKSIIKQKLFKNGPIVIFIWKNEANWPVEEISDNIKNIYGYEPSLYTNGTLHYSEQIHPEDLHQVFREVKEATENIECESFTHLPYRFLDADNNYRWIKDTTVLIRNESKKVTHYVGYIIDITNEMSLLSEQKKLEESILKERNFISTIVDNANSIIAVIDSNGVMIKINPYGANFVGYTPEEIKSEPYFWARFVPESVRGKVRDIITNANNGTIIKSFQNAWISKDGVERIFEWSNTLVKKDDGSMDYIATIGIDITEKKEIEKNIIKAKEDAENANKAKSQFLANMSHEIRTPLNGIIGLTDLTLKSDLNSTQKDYLQKVQRSSKALLNVINDILDYSKIEAGKLSIEETDFNLESILINVGDLFGYKAQEKGIEIYFNINQDIPSNLIGDPLRITQILNNLVGNAIKFTTGGEIEVNIYPLNIKNKNIELLFSVKDNGIGISKEQQERLFKPFSQVDASSTRKYGGTGLGLTISKQLVELMGGSIWLESDIGRGSKFSFTIKLRYTKSINSLKLKVNNLKGKKFLLLDEQESERKIISDIFKSWKLDLILSNSSFLAIELCKINSFDYIFVDSAFIKREGLSIISDLATILPNAKIVLIVNTFTKDSILSKLKEDGVKIESLLSKPFTPSTLFDSINNLHLSIDEPEFQNDVKIIANGKILLVEDNEINQIVARENLKNFGFDVVIANNGLEAVERAEKESFDAILMDLQMPILDGFEATRRIREFDKKTPIIALSAAVMQRDREMTKEAGMNEHISKPIDIEELENILCKYLTCKKISNPPKEYKKTEKFDDIIDIEALIDRVGDKELAYDVLIEFVKQYRDINIKLDAYSVGGEEFNKLVHSLKGVSGTLSLIRIYNIAFAINQSNDIELKRELLPKLQAEIEVAIDMIDSEIVKFRI